MDLDCADDDLPEFFKVYITIHSSNYMVIPTDFERFMDRRKSGPAELVASRSGETWRVEFFNNGTDLCFKEGWRDFVEGNFIKDGDFMFFKFHGNLVFSFVIYDESMCEKEMGKCRGGRRRGRDGFQESKEKQSVSTVKQKVDEPSSASEVRSKTAKRAVHVKPFFEKRITEYHANANMSLPAAFISENHLSYKSNEKMILRTSRRASWEINVINNRGTIVMSGGWIAFIRENSINVGDVCKFELLDKLEMMVHVNPRSRFQEGKGSGKKR